MAPQPAIALLHPKRAKTLEARHTNTLIVIALVLQLANIGDQLARPKGECARSLAVLSGPKQAVWCVHLSAPGGQVQFVCVRASFLALPIGAYWSGLERNVARLGKLSVLVDRWLA